VKPLGVALIGVGPGAVPHLRSLWDLREQIALRGVVARRPQLADLGPFSGQLRAVSDLEGVLDDPLVEAVIIATPPATHLELAQACFARAKHLLLEKPLDVSLERARKIVELADQSGCRLGVVLQHRFRPAAQALAELMAQSALGPIQTASVQVPWWRPQSYYEQSGRGTRARDGGGVLITQAIHSIDLFRSLVGVRRVVAAQISRTRLHAMETEDHAQALLELADGAPGLLVASTAHYPGRPERIEILGSQALAVLEGGRLKVDYVDGRRLEIEAEGGTGSGANIMDFPHDAHRALIENFMAATRHGHNLRVDGRQALLTQQLIEDVLTSGGPVQGL
jgi:predicted dehydrogenase